MTKTITKKKASKPTTGGEYPVLLGGVSELLESARRASARAVNAVMTATYWEIGRRIVEHEQGGRDRAKYGDAVIKRLALDLTAKFGRGFGRRNVFQMRAFYLACPQPVIKSPGSRASATPKVQALSALSAAKVPAAAIVQTVSAQSSTSLTLTELARAFPLPWSHYVPAHQPFPFARGIHILSHRGPAGRLDRSPTPAANGQPVLRTHSTLPQQGGHARQRR